MNTERILIDYFVRHHPLNATRLLERLRAEDITQFIKEIPSSLVLALFNQMEHNTASRSLARLDAGYAAEIVEKLPIQKVSNILRRVDKEQRELILNKVNEKISEPLRIILSYTEDRAAALADPAILSMPDDISVSEALERIQKYPDHALYYLYIVNRAQSLTGVLTMRELFSARPSRKLSEIMHGEVVFLSAGLTVQAVLDHHGWQNFHALPVTGENGILLGAIDYDTMRRIEREHRRIGVPQQAIAASNALGELFQIGLSGLIRSAAAQVSDRSGTK